MTSPDDPAHTVAPGAIRAQLPGEASEALPAGTRLREFEIVSVIGQGGFGIVYLANDRTLGRRVALKEYMPSTLATRRSEGTVSVRSPKHDETFAAGLRSFINEARLLAQFDHPSLLKVYQFWEDHGTAYMVMPFYEGITLDKLLPQLGGRPDEAWLRALIDPLLDALELLHQAHCWHRDVAPDNILILPDGRPLLLDFGAARQVIGAKTNALTVILKTGYAPVEQYGEMPEMRQGPWTDLYALASVVEFAITGKTPPQAVARFLGDKREPLAVRADGLYGDAFLRAIDRSLAVQPGDRPQSVADLRAMLARGATAPVPLDHESPTLHPVHAPAFEMRADPPRAPASGRTGGPDAEASPRAARMRPLVAGLVAAGVTFVVVGGAAWLALRPSGPPLPNIASAPIKAVVIETAPVPAEPATGVPASAATAPDLNAAPPAAAAEPAVAAVPAVTEATPNLPPPAVQARPGDVPLDRVEATIRELLPPNARDSLPPAPAEPVAPAPRAGRAARAARADAPLAATERPAPKSASRSVRHARCDDIIQRSSLGEELSETDKSFLKQECRQ